MPTFRVYYDAVIHYSGVMEIQAATEEDAQTLADLTPPELDGLGPENVTTFEVTHIEAEEDDTTADQARIEEDADRQEALWAQHHPYTKEHRA